METLAVIGVVLVCSMVLGLQHLFNYWIRQDLDRTPTPIFGVIGIIASAIILLATILKVVAVWGCSPK